MKKKIFIITFISIIIGSVVFYKYFREPDLKFTFSPSKFQNYLVTIYNSNEILTTCFFASYIPEKMKLSIFFFHPITKLNSNDKILIQEKYTISEDISEFLENTFKIKNIQKLTLNESDFNRTINYLGGIKLYIDPSQIQKSENYHFPKGLVRLFGEEIFEFISYTENYEPLQLLNRLERQETFVLSFLRKITQYNKNLDPLSIQFLSSLFHLNLTDEQIENFLQIIQNENLQIDISEFPGELVFLEKNNEYFLQLEEKKIFKYYKITIERLLSEDFSDLEYSNLEILNGTKTTGLANKTKNILNEKNIKILAVGNYWNEEAKSSFVIGRSGNTKILKELGEKLKIQKIFYSVNKNLGIDATVVLGKDFYLNEILEQNKK